MYLKSILLAFSLFLGATSLWAQEAQATLTLTITGVKSTKGNLCIALYNSKETFLDTEKVFKTVDIPLKGLDLSKIKIAAIPYGTYSIAVFVDGNTNKKLDTNFLGIPKEAYGFSAAKLPKFRAPTFEEVAFPVKTKEKHLTITVK